MSDNTDTNKQNNNTNQVLKEFIPVGNVNIPMPKVAKPKENSSTSSSESDSQKT